MSLRGNPASTIRHEEANFVGLMFLHGNLASSLSHEVA